MLVPWPPLSLTTKANSKLMKFQDREYISQLSDHGKYFKDDSRQQISKGMMTVYGFKNVIDRAESYMRKIIDGRIEGATSGMIAIIIDYYFTLRFEAYQSFNSVEKWEAARDKFLHWVESYYGWPLPLVEGINAVHLQGVGKASALMSCELIPGDVTLWNHYGQESILKTESETLAFIKYVIQYESSSGDIVKSSRRLKKTRLVGCYRVHYPLFDPDPEIEPPDEWDTVDDDHLKSFDF